MSESVQKSVITSVATSGHLLNTSSVKWSQNNCIAVIVNKYLYVLSSHSDPTEWCHRFPYHKSIIHNPKQSMTFDCGISLRQVLSSCGLDEQQLLMLDPTLASETANSTTFLSYRCIDWSPICGQLGCLLGALTLDHRLVIYRKDVNDWELALDLSLVLNEKMKEFWTAIETSDYQSYRERMYTLATNTFCWAKKWRECEDDRTKRNCFLYMGSKNGLITVWDITVSMDLQIGAQLIHKWKSHSVQINCLKTINELLIISFSNGLVSAIHTDFSHDSEPNPLSIWSQSDNIYVNHFAVKTIDENNFDILFSKSDFVIICRINADINGENVVLNLKCLQTVPGLHRMPPTGICSIVDSKYIMTALDGRVIQIDVTDDMTVTQTEVTLENVNPCAMSAYGIDSSPNGVLSVLVQTIVPYHDHLVFKEPIQVLVFANISFDYLSELLIEKYLSKNVVQNKSSIEECFDYMDCVRSFITSSHNSNVDKSLFQLISDQNLIKECNDLLKLKLIRFITKVYLMNCRLKASQSVLQTLESNIQLCEDMALKLYIEDRYGRQSYDSQSLTKSQLSSLKNMYLWLWKRFSVELFQKSCLDFDSIQDMCPICEHPIVLDSPTHGNCSQSHHFNRCTNSMVLCDFVNNKYEKCFRCFKSFVITPSVWNQPIICLYCL